MMVLAIGIEHALDVAIERSQHSDTRVHNEIATFCSADQTRDSSLPFLKVLLSLRQLHDVIGSVLEGYELAPLGQRDRIVEWPLPASWSATQSDPRPSASTSRRLLTGGLRASHRQPPDASPRHIPRRCRPRGLGVSLNETHCGRWIASCCLAHPIVCRCCNLGPKSRGRPERSAKLQGFASHFPLRCVQRWQLIFPTRSRLPSQSRRRSLRLSDQKPVVSKKYVPMQSQ